MGQKMGVHFLKATALVLPLHAYLAGTTIFWPLYARLHGVQSSTISKKGDSALAAITFLSRRLRRLHHRHEPAEEAFAREFMSLQNNKTETIREFGCRK